MEKKMSNRNRKLYSKPRKTGGREYYNLRLSTRKKLTAVALATLLGISSISFLVNVGHDRKVTIGRAVDNLADEYDGKIPVYDEDKVIGTIGDGSYIIVDGVENEDELLTISGISENGDLITGQVDSKCVENTEKISSKKIDEYDTIYTVKPEEGVNLRSSAEIADDNKVTAISGGEQVLGSTKLLPEDNKFTWIPVIYVNEKEIDEGYIRSDLLEKEGTLYIEKQDEEDIKQDSKIKMVVDTSKDNSVDLKLRSEKTINSENIITTIPDGSVVYALDDVIEESDSIEWRRVEFASSSGDIYTGWVANGYLKEYNEITKVVNTSGSGTRFLNVRRRPGTDSEKIAEIETGTKIEIPEADIEARQKVGNNEWVKVTLTDGTVGYVAYEYLEDVKEKAIVPSSEIVKEVLENKTVSKSGKVVGIDISSRVLPEQLEELLKGGDVIGDYVPRLDYSKGEPTYVDADTKDISGKINYAYIKLGASAHGKGNLTILSNDNYKKQAEICEKYNIPYGFYYYSTAIDKTEAKEEANYIKNAIESLSNREHNLLPVALDVELSGGTGDRQYGKDLTDVKAYLANLVEPKLGKTILYGGGRALAPTSDEAIMNIDQYNDKLDTGDTLVWLAAPRTSEGAGVGETTRGYINSISEQSNIAILQTLLDAKLKDIGVDIDMMDEEVFDKMIDNQYQELKDIIGIKKVDDSERGV